MVRFPGSVKHWSRRARGPTAATCARGPAATHTPTDTDSGTHDTSKAQDDLSHHDPISEFIFRTRYRRSTVSGDGSRNKEERAGSLSMQTRARVGEHLSPRRATGITDATARLLTAPGDRSSGQLAGASGPATRAPPCAAPRPGETRCAAPRAVSPRAEWCRWPGWARAGRSACAAPTR